MVSAVLIVSVVLVPALSVSASGESASWVSGSSVFQAPAILAILWLMPRMVRGHERWPFWRLTSRALPGLLGAVLGFIAGGAALHYATTWGAWGLVPQSICWWGLSSLLLLSSVKVAIKTKRQSNGEVARNPGALDALES